MLLYDVLYLRILDFAVRPGTSKYKCFRYLSPGAPEIGYLAQHQLLDQVNRLQFWGRNEHEWFTEMVGINESYPFCYNIRWMRFRFHTQKARCRGHKEMSSVLADQYRPPKCGGRGVVAGSQPMSTAVHIDGAQLNFWNLTPYFIYWLDVLYRFVLHGYQTF